MATQKVNQNFTSASALTITLASLASSTSGVGRQATEVDLSGSSDQQWDVTIQYSIKLGTSPTGNRAVYFYALSSDGTHRDGVAGSSDAAFTIPPNIFPVHVAPDKSSPATGDVLQGSFTFRMTGPRFVIAVVHDTGVNLNSTGGNHYIKYVARKPDIQAAA